jgi:hypothetical protein
LIKRDLLNLQTIIEQITQNHPRHESLVRLSLQQAGRSIDSAIAALGIDPDDDRLMELLDECVAQADRETESIRSEGILDVADDVDAAELFQRLLLVSRAAALRADANFVYARDLNLAAAARAAWPEDDIDSFAKSLAAVRHANEAPAEAEAARQALRKHVKPNPELDAFDAAAKDSNAGARIVQAVPAIAAMLQDPPANSTIAPADRSALTDQSPPTTGPSASRSVGFDEPLRLYFQMLREKQ